MENLSNQTDEKRQGKTWRNVLDSFSYELIVRNIYFLLFLACLGIVYITNNHFAEKNVRNLNKKQRELKELRWKHIDAKTRYMFQSKQSEVIRNSVPLGLKELMAPPYRIDMVSQHQTNGQ
jgi:restriction endonuclease